MSEETYWVKKQLMNSDISGWYETYSIPVGNALKNWPGISSRTRTRVVQTTIELHPEVSSWVQKVEPTVAPTVAPTACDDDDDDERVIFYFLPSNTTFFSVMFFFVAVYS